MTLCTLRLCHSFRLAEYFGPGELLRLYSYIPLSGHGLSSEIVHLQINYPAGRCSPILN
ncbi:hypothetical protein AG1IA_01943 [Rhizoctonia solani AG-1 IA]|uniref:Uncharacterized protein n=1 Tax=Thanatephorus cucumeris (strain AG1-IA) TaxID=983506 RepID=L8X4J0_THACA|nr:hypothetical protein AG1IA_01943 [Rhizoctonia solani AG-1 IA]